MSKLSHWHSEENSLATALGSSRILAQYQLKIGEKFQGHCGKIYQVNKDITNVTLVCEDEKQEPSSRRIKGQEVKLMVEEWLARAQDPSSRLEAELNAAKEYIS